MNKQRLAILICAAVGMLATFMPWVSTIMGSLSGTDDGGWITLCVFAVPIIIALLGDRNQGLPSANSLIVLVAGIGAAGVGIWKIIDLKSKTNSLAGDSPFSSLISNAVSVGIGLYLVVIAGIAIALVAFVLKDKATVIVKSALEETTV